MTNVSTAKHYGIIRVISSGVSQSVRPVVTLCRGSTHLNQYVDAEVKLVDLKISIM